MAALPTANVSIPSWSNHEMCFEPFVRLFVFFLCYDPPLDHERRKHVAFVSHLGAAAI